MVTAYSRRTTQRIFRYLYHTMDNHKYLSLLAEKYPNAFEATRAQAILEARQHLIKGTEVYLSDVHGEHEAFQHLVRNGSGVIKQTVETLFADALNDEARKELTGLIYYPKGKLEYLNGHPQHFTFQELIRHLVQVAQHFLPLHTTNQLSRLLPDEYTDMILDLVLRLDSTPGYADQLIQSGVHLGLGHELIHYLAILIQKMSVQHLHIIGDIYDRGPGAEIIIDELISHQSCDFQWGNHDIVWMGAASGSEACMANVLRLSLRYGNTDTLEKGYGIHLMPLASFALEHYKDDKSLSFEPRISPDELLNESEQWLNRIMHKAISIIQFKLEGQLILRRPEFNLNDRLLLDKLNLDKGVLALHGGEYPLTDEYFPTLDPEYPWKLSEEEARVMQKISRSFTESPRLQRHARFLFEKGSMYHLSNNNLLYHGCVPLTPDGHFKTINLGKGNYRGKALFDFLNLEIIKARSSPTGSQEESYALDLLWYLWAGPGSPVFGKHKMATFERYFLTEKALHREIKDPYYSYRDDPSACEMILEEFGLNGKQSVILNGHVPVEVKEGENPVKANGKLIVIDGGFAKAYQSKTGIAGYTLIHNARGRQLIAHEPFENREMAIAKGTDIAFNKTILEQAPELLKIKDMPEGETIQTQIDDLQRLLVAYQDGKLKERSS